MFDSFTDFSLFVRFSTVNFIIPFISAIAKMKCLLCNLPFETSNGLKDHYINFYKVERNNYFFKKNFLVSWRIKLYVKKCFRCDEFVTTKNHKNVHNFLKHYFDGKKSLLKINQWKLRKLALWSYVKLATTYMSIFMIFDEFLKNVKVRFKSNGGVVM